MMWHPFFFIYAKLRMKSSTCPPSYGGNHISIRTLGWTAPRQELVPSTYKPFAHTLLPVSALHSVFLTHIEYALPRSAPSSSEGMGVFPGSLPNARCLLSCLHIYTHTYASPTPPPHSSLLLSSSTYRTPLPFLSPPKCQRSPTLQCQSGQPLPWRCVGLLVP